MKKLLANLKSISPYYFIWIITILVVGIWSIRSLPFTPSFPYYGDLSNRYSREVASFAHFDGIHYLRLINKGYDDTGSQAFFPVYPLIIYTLSFGVFDPLYVAIVLNVTLVFASLILITNQLTDSHRTKFLLLFLSFPTSFYLITNYTESLFIFLVSLFFYFSKKKKYLLAAIVAGIASATRVVGIFLALTLLVELIQYFNANRQIITRSFWLYVAFMMSISVSGLLMYSIYLNSRYGDPLKFVHVMSMFGVGRSTGEIVLLPQLLYRYFRILTTSPLTSIIGLRALWELVTLVITGIALYVARHKLSLPAMIFCLSVIIFPTLSGTLSSFPRYVLVAVPLFGGVAEVMDQRLIRVVSLIQYVILISVVALFVQGIFIA